VGTFTGFSALAAALVMPDDGEVLTMDVTDTYYKPAGGVRAREAGVDGRIRLVVAPAKDTLGEFFRTCSLIAALDELLANGTAGVWDFCFIDADKVNYDVYYERCLQLLRVGGIISVDNALWFGAVTRAPSTMSSSTAVLHALNVKIAADERVMNTLLPFADGINVVLKL